MLNDQYDLEFRPLGFFKVGKGRSKQFLGDRVGEDWSKGIFVSEPKMGYVYNSSTLLKPVFAKDIIILCVLEGGGGRIYIKEHKCHSNVAPVV